jgi:uncharacterized protein
MRLDEQQSSQNVDDRRSRGGGGGRLGGGMKLSGGMILGVVVIGALMGQNPLQLLAMLAGSGAIGGGAPTQQAPRSPDEDRAAVFTSKVLATTESAWSKILQASGSRYPAPTLVLFRDAVDSACGQTSAAVGPFYCPADSKLYIDLSFFDELSQRLGAPGDFAQAYVVAHEVGHHIQNLTGASDKVQRSGNREGADGPLVRLELQADCYAGVWAHDVNQKGLLDVGDVDEALRAAWQIGDDTLQKRGRGKVVPDSFSHGTSEQRARWFKRGMQSGDPSTCDTFAQQQL